jgi:YVTN family beta-propeller protein
VAHAFAPDNWKEGLRYINVDVFDLRSYLVGPQFGYVGAAPVKVAVNSQLHRAYVSNYYDKLAVIDTTTNTRLGWVKQKNYQGGWGIFASPLINWVHLATRDTGELVVFDGGNGDRLLQDGYIPTHFKPPSPCALYLTVAHEDTDHVFVTCPARKSVFFLVEPEMSILAAGELGTLELRQDGWVRVVQPQEVTWRELTFTDSHVSTNVGVWGIAVDRPAKRVYITDPIGDMLIVIQDDNNTGNVRVANYVRGPFDEPQGVAVDPAWQRIYVANAGNNTVTVLNALTPTQVISTVNLALP